MSTCRMKLDLHLSSFSKTNSKGIEDLNLKPETLKLLAENTETILYDRDIRKDFLNKTPFTQELMTKK